MRTVNIPVFVPHKGCPNDCVFCNQKTITGKSDMTPEIAAKYIEKCIKTIPENAKCQIAFFGGSFTAVEKTLQEEFLKTAFPYVKSGAVSGIRVSTRPDCIDKENLKLLKNYGTEAIELGVQSTDDNVLRLANRGHTFEDVKNAVKIIKEFGGFELGLQMMTGLLGDTYEKTVKTAQDIIDLGADTTRIYPTLVIRGSRLAQMYEKGEYEPISVKEAVLRCAAVYEMFLKANMRVLRIGLMSSEEIRENSGSVLAGPVCSNFGERVYSKIFLNKFEKCRDGKSELCVAVNPKDISKAVGNKKENIRYFKEKFACELKIEADSSVLQNEIKVTEGKKCI